MEENIINIATLTIDSTKATESIVSTKEEIFKLQKANTELRKEIQTSTGDTTEQTKAFVENESKLKQLNTSYRAQQNALNEYTLEQVKNTEAVTKSAKSIDEANKQNKELLKIRNQVDATTVEGSKAIELLNKKMDENNKFILANKNEQEKASTITGNYRQHLFGLTDAFSSQEGVLSNVKTNFLGFQSTVSGTINTVKDVHNSVVGAATGIMGFGNASKIAAVESAALATAQEGAAVAATTMAAGEEVATVASGGLVSVLGVLLFPITAIIAAGLLLYNVFKDFGPVINPIKDGITALGASFIVIKDGILDLVTGARSLSNVFSSLGSDMADATVETYKLEQAQRGLTKAMDVQDVANKRAETKAKEYFIQAKNIKLTIEERQELLQKGQKIEEETLKDNLKNNEKQHNIYVNKLKLGKALTDQQILDLARGDYEAVRSWSARQKIDSETLKSYKDNLIQKDDLTQKSQSYTERSINYENRIVEKDQAKKEKAQEAANKKSEDNAKKEHDRQIKSLANTRLVFESEISTTEEKLKFYENYYSKLNKLEGNENKIKNAKDLSATILNIAKSEIDGEIELQTKKIQEKKTLDKQQKNDLIANAEFLKSEQTKSVKKSLLNEVDKNAALLEIQKGFNENVAVINKEFEDGEAARKEEQKNLDALDHEMKMLVLEEQGFSELELKSRILKEEHKERIRLISEQVDAEGNLTKTAIKEKENEEKKYAKATKAIDKEVAKNKKAMTVDIVKQSIAAASIMFEDNKALAVATALISTYEGIAAQIATKPKTPYEIGLVIANSAVVAATGFAAVRNIMKTDKGSSGSSSSGSGTTASASVFENPAKTQTVASVGSAPTIDQPQGMQPVLVLETLDEAKKNQIIKVNSN